MASIHKEREKLVDLDPAARRLAYSAAAGRITHHNASQQVFAAENDRSRVVWVTDVLPELVVETFETMLEQGATSMRRTLENDLAPRITAENR